jgi:sugar lactone lactonase YvrE
MPRSAINFNNGLLVTLVLLVSPIEGIVTQGQPSADQTAKQGANQSVHTDAPFGGYQIIKRLAAPNAPLGGGRSPQPKLVFEDNQARYWIAGIRGGRVQLYDERSGQWDSFSSGQSGREGIHFHDDALLPEDIAHICQSKDGTVWFSDHSFSQASLDAWKDRLFLTSFDGKQWRSFTFATKLTGSIGLVQGTDGRVWFWARDEFRFWDQGRWSEPTRISDVLKEPPAPNSRSESTDESRTQKRPEFRHEIIAATQDREGYLWLSTHSGVITYDPQTHKFREYPDLRDVRASSIYEDHEGRIWFNDLFTALTYNKSTGTVKRYDPLDHIEGPLKTSGDKFTIEGICQDRRGRMIFALFGGVVILSEIDDKWSFAPTNALGLDVEGLPNELLNIMEDKKGRIWLTGFNGIALIGQSDPGRDR